MRRPKSSPNRSKIAIDHADEVKYWTKHFQVTPDELRRVIEKVGNSAAAVRKELGRPESRSSVADRAN